MRIVVRQIGPGMMQQMQQACPACKGQGQVVPESGRCKPCAGRKTVKDKKQLEVFIQRGSKNNSRVTFRGEADEAPGTEPGDVVVVLQEQPHSVFRREG